MKNQAIETSLILEANYDKELVEAEKQEVLERKNAESSRKTSTEIVLLQEASQ